jgi:uncharacterized protein
MPSRTRHSWARARALLATIALVAAGSFAVTPPVAATSPNVVISQVYGGGGNSGATLKNDFIELYNLGPTTVDITGWTVQYASAAGTAWQTTTLNGTVGPARYYLVQEAAGTGGTVDLPVPNASGSIAMAAGSGKVALVSNATTLTGSCPIGVVDFVGYGIANCYEGAGAAPLLTNATADLRSGGGATDTDNNRTDFTAGAPNPRNTPPPDLAPTVSSTVPGNGAAFVALDSSVTVTFSEPVTVGGTWFTLGCSVSGDHSATVSAGPTVFTLNPEVDFATGDVCTLTVFAAQVTDQDGTPDAMAANASVVFATGSTCTLPYTPIPSIEGSGATVALTGTQTTQGVVVGDYEGPSPALRGFYIEDPTGDGNPATSDGIFVFEGSNANTVTLGDVVRVTGTAGESQGQSQISVGSIVNCGTSSVAPVAVTLPFASSTDAERFEGMLVSLPQTLSVTESFQLGRFDEVLLSSGGRLPQPTNVTTPGPSALALQAQDDLNQILLDDASQTQNPDPILFGRGGLPLSASNTLRGGDTATGIVGVMTYTWGGNSASPNAYRVRPINALGGTAVFDVTNPRPATAPAPTGRLRVAGMNLLNFFNTFSGCTNGVDGAATDCRGASNQAEFDRQWPKTVAAIMGTGADVVGVTELENDGYGPGSAVAFLVDELNAATAPGTYAFINADAGTGQTNALGFDAIKVGFLYKSASVTPVGTTAALNSDAFVNGGDTAPRNRAALAQAFEERATGARFVVSVNHLKSKGSACDLPDQGDGQANCSAVRTQAANLLTAWLASDPTGTSDPDALIVGDLNSYALEDPITTIKSAGYTDLVNEFEGPTAYSYVFDGLWGYLDHALANAALAPQVTGVADWHINADEPPVLDYNTEFKTANLQTTLYAPDAFRAADHDPVLVDLDLIIPLPFRGFFSPVQPAPAFNVANAGRTIPLKFSLGGDRGLDIFRLAPTVTPIACSTRAVNGAPIAAVGKLRYDAASGQYIYTWQTDKAWTGGCAKLSFLLVDGTPHAAYFDFRK